MLVRSVSSKNIFGGKSQFHIVFKLKWVRKYGNMNQLQLTTPRNEKGEKYHLIQPTMVRKYIHQCLFF